MAALPQTGIFKWILQIALAGATVSLPLLFQAVAAEHVVFAGATGAYLLLANRFRFDGNAANRDRKPISLVEPTAAMIVYVRLAAVLGLLFPVLLVVFNPLSPMDRWAALYAVAPHLFLLLVQVQLEQLQYHRNMAILVRLLCPIAFNSYRLITLYKWLQASRALGWPHQAVAGANFAFWHYNLFIFLLLNVVPQYLREKPEPS
eukprot:jgi/Chlat1/2511/Chrsp175S02377